MSERTKKRSLPKKKPGPGRPKGSKPHPEWGLTPSQMGVAEKIIEASIDGGIFPSSVADLAKLTGIRGDRLRPLLKRDDFQRYFNHLLAVDSIMLEGAFWRSMALGLSVGDVKVMELYARISGKIAATKKDTKVEIVVISPEGAPALPAYTKDVIEATVIEDV